MRLEPKFFANLEDDNHCLQAAIMMVLNTIKSEISWEEVNKMTEYEDGLYSWASRATVALSEKVPGTRLVSAMDYNQFADKGQEYFREYSRNNLSWFELQKQHASTGFKKEQNAAQELVQNNLVAQRSFTKEDIEQLLEDHLIIALVDSGKLARKDWSVGHFVVVYNQDGNNFFLHDPGLPPKKSWLIDKQRFMEAFQNESIIVPNNGFRFGTEVGPNDPCPCGSGKKFKKCHGA